MINIETFLNTSMGKAVSALADEMKAYDMPPVELNVIGGFALMLRGVRDPNDITDIDYVGVDLYEKFNAVSEKIGVQYGMEPGWINNDGMLVGDSMDDFEISTGELHFEHAVTIGPISINVLTEKDLLRMKLIAVDTAMTEMEATGDFARRKDFSDIDILMRSQNMTPDDVMREFGEYILCEPDTFDLIDLIYEGGVSKAIQAVDKMSDDLKAMRQAHCARGPSPYLENLMDQLMKRAEKMRLEDEDLDFSDDQNITIL